MYQSTRRERPLQVVLEVGSHSALREVLRRIQAADVEAKTAAITPADLTEETTVSVDLGILTEKQRRTLALAISSGYYERPREIELSTLADQLDISKSAVSQRLRAAETKLIKNAFERFR